MNEKIWVIRNEISLNSIPTEKKIKLNGYTTQEKKLFWGLCGNFISSIIGYFLYLFSHHSQIPCFERMKVTAAVFVVTIISWAANSALSIRFPDRISENPKGASDQPLRTAVFALGSFWRSEAAFGCLDGVVRTAAGYAGGSRPNPEFRSLGDHAECVQVVILSFPFYLTLLCVVFAEFRSVSFVFCSYFILVFNWLLRIILVVNLCFRRYLRC